MDIVETFIGSGKELDALQMSTRGIIVFFIGLVLIRISGRRSFGMAMPFDNVITILLGAVLSRAVVGASPFLSVIAASTVIVLLHRLCAMLCLYSHAFGKLIKGEERIVYEHGKMNEANLKRSLVTKEDLIENIRLNGNIEDLKKAKSIYVERNGSISVIKKEE